MGIRESIGLGFGSLALILALTKSMKLMNGWMTLGEFVTPGWTGFVTPEPFVWILIVGASLFGSGFVIFTDNA